MRGLIPFGGLHITGGAQTQALTTTGGALVAWSAAGGSNSSDDTYNAGGDPAVRPDATNNRVLVNTPGTYLVMFVIEGAMTTGADLVAQVRKNAVAVSLLKSKARITTNKGQLVLTGILTVTRADSPGTIATSADPATTEYIGPAGKEKTMCAVDVILSVAASTDTLTIEEAQLTLLRIG